MRAKAADAFDQNGGDRSKVLAQQAAIGIIENLAAGNAQYTQGRSEFLPSQLA
jgi:hypothetical protein